MGAVENEAVSDLGGGSLNVESIKSVASLAQEVETDGLHPQE